MKITIIVPVIIYNARPKITNYFLLTISKKLPLLVQIVSFAVLSKFTRSIIKALFVKALLAGIVKHVFGSRYNILIFYNSRLYMRDLYDRFIDKKQRRKLYWGPIFRLKYISQ